MTILESKAVQYARECIEPDNLRAPIYVKKQCAAWLDIVEGKDPDAHISEKSFRVICNTV